MARKFYGNIDMQSNRITGLSDPSANTDAATKQYVDNVARGISWKQPVDAASTANVSLTAPGTTMDGVTLSTGMRLLLKNQTTGSENGIYTWTGSGATLTRTADADTGTELNPGTSVTVIGGTANGDKVFLVTSDAAVTIGTTATTWGQLGGGAVTYSAGLGLTLASTTFAIDTTIVVRKFATNVPSSTSPAITHNLGTLDVQVAVYIIGTGEQIECDIFRTDSNTVTLGFASAPAASTLRVVIQG